MSRLETLAEYGFKRDPFPGCFLETADVLRVKGLISMAVESKRMIAIVADRGAGKTEAVGHALREIKAAIVRADVSNKERMTIDHIETDFIMDLTEEPIRRGASSRKRQLRRVVGEASRKSPIILLIEEAHRLHPQTLKSLKTLLEMEWAGQKPLFTVILVGQYDPMSKAGVSEVTLRSDTIYMKGISAEEVANYIDTTVGEYFDGDAVTALSRLPESRNFLDLQEMCVTLMARALSLGQKHVTAVETFEIYGGGLREISHRVNMSDGDLSKETGMPRSIVNSIINDKQRTIKDETFKTGRAAIAEVLRRRMSEASGDTLQKGPQADKTGPMGVVGKI